MIRIKLVAIEEDLHNAWRKHCADLDCVEIVCGSILDVKCDAVVSPANSFGFMDGGIDLAYSNHFGWGVQSRLQEIIRARHHGQLLVGQAELVPTENEEVPFLIAAPTMRVPQSLHNSPNPYLAMRAVLILIKHGQHEMKAISEMINTIAVPGLGTGVGEINPIVCAKQIRHAVEEVLYEKHEFPESWFSAQELHYSLVVAPRNA
ncbi:Appr-1-p processing protein [Mangrovimicrobium sediminis]|uniref:Appr-1-p processing protein n=1 Tax=Mangrovimicrobium sediminis TaxID=2562682 RepID=A0A4Z0LTV6_9GAMM|nr:macro domain-containing protein [Haliea sp. SAOS-164]TGD70712.1 Appr-1-p processing protein [Haliea sp. SAOS-164]